MFNLNAEELLNGLLECQDEEIQELKEKLRKAEQLSVVVAQANIIEGTWDCEHEEIDKCWYNDEEDPLHDECIFCGDPDERK